MFMASRRMACFAGYRAHGDGDQRCGRKSSAGFMPGGDGHPSDLRDAEWARLEPMIPPAQPGGRSRKIASGNESDPMAATHRLPLALLAARLVFRRAGRRTTSSADFEREGVWETISAELHMAVRERMEREASPSAAMLDSQSVKSPGEGPAETANITATANMWRAAGSPASCLPAGVC